MKVLLSLFLGLVLLLPISTSSTEAGRPCNKGHPENCPTPTPTLTATPTPLPTPTPISTPVVTPVPTPTGWTLLVNDQFDSGGIPSHWFLYDGPYGSYNPGSCAKPSHATVVNGYLRMLMSYESTGTCGATWYSAGLGLGGYSSIDARITTRFRLVHNGILSHFNIPMRWPDNDASWPAAGEENYCEGAGNSCSTYLHYGANNSQILRENYITGLDQWHTFQAVRLNHIVNIFLDGVLLWTYNGNSTTLPDTLKHVVLQQECPVGNCPQGTTGSDEVQIDWIMVEVPS